MLKLEEAINKFGAMKKINFIYNFTICAVILMSFAACQKDVNTLSEESTAGQVSVTLNISVDDMGAGTAESRALTRADLDGDGVESDVANLLILQFDGSSDAATISDIIYIDDMSSTEITLDQTYVSTVVVFVANTFGDYSFSTSTTLSEVKNSAISLSGVVETLTTSFGEEILYDSSLIKEGSDGNKYFLMSGSYLYADGVQYGGSISVSLKRNVSKVTLNVTNNWAGTDITNININSIPLSYLYYAYRNEESADDDDTSTFIPSYVSSSTSYKNTTSLNTATTNSKTVTCYVPVNMRGAVEESTAETKPDNAPSGATYASILVYPTEGSLVDGLDEDQWLRYNFYLGANLTNDYNLEPNKYYTYNISINGMGDAEADSRVTLLKTVAYGDYTSSKSSNCYILNPSPDAESSFYIPIAPRINEYWGGDYANVPDYCIDDNDDSSWEYKVLWYDNTLNPISTNEDNLLTHQLYIEKCLKGESDATPSLAITLGAGFSNYGNVLVAVTKNDVIVWSWHLWITDYNPYDHELTDLSAGSHTLSNGTGALHRYTGTVWSSGGIYEDKYIMDRNIGARRATISSAADAGYLHYQFGRKDPFPYSGTKVNDPALGGSTIKESVSMSTAIANPTTKYAISGDWCNEDTNNSLLWNDKKLTDTAAGEKSIFDPSPYGFRLPISSVWSDMTLNGVSVEGVHNDDNGYGFNFEDSSGNEFLYPACGYIANSSSSYQATYINDYAIYLSATAANGNSNKTSHAYSICKTVLSSTQLFLFKSSAASLRCIEDVDEEE